MKKTVKLILVLATLCTLSGCYSKPESAFSFHLAQTRVTGLEQNLTEEELPLSEMACKVDSRHFMSSNELLDVDGASVGLANGESLLGFYFTTTDLGKNRLLSATAENQGAFIILKESRGKELNKIIGARQIDAAIHNGKIFIIPEIEFESDEEFDELIESWKESIRRHRAIRDAPI